jgi:hypothetical protein
MGGQQSLLKGDVVEWYLQASGSQYDLFGRVATKNQTDEDSETILSKSKKIGSVGNTACGNACFKITHLDDDGNFTLKKGNTTHRLLYHSKYIGWVAGSSPTKLLDMAYYQLGNS